MDLGDIPDIMRNPFPEGGDTEQVRPSNWDFHHTSENIPSSRKQREKKSKSSLSIQTEKIPTTEQGIQVHKSQSVETQTPDQTTHLKVNPAALTAFMNRVTPMICMELSDNSSLEQINIFKEYIAEMDEPVIVKDEPKKLFSFKNKTGEEHGFNCGVLAWNRSGVYMAVAYAAADHSENPWCRHETVLALYNTNKLAESSSLYPEPDRELAGSYLLSAQCFTALEFSPHEGFLMAAGKITGEIVLVEFNTFSAIEMTKYIKSYECHSERIVALQWLTLSPRQLQTRSWQNPEPSYHFLISASKDGSVGLWSLGRISFTLILERKLALSVENIPKSIPINRKVVENFPETGLTALSVSPAYPTRFVFATYGGYVFSGDIFSDLKSKSEESTGSNEMPIYEPDASPISSNKDGMVSALRCSPFHQSYVLILTLHGHLTLRNIDEDKSTLEFYVSLNDSCMDVQWSPIRPMMFAVAAGREILIYDLLQSRLKPTMTLKHANVLRAIRFNKNSPREIAVVDMEGEVIVWELSSEISRRKAKELSHLLDLEDAPETNTGTNEDSKELARLKEEELRKKEFLLAQSEGMAKIHRKLTRKCPIGNGKSKLKETRHQGHQNDHSKDLAQNFQTDAKEDSSPNGSTESSN